MTRPIESLLEELEKRIPDQSRENPAVSAGNTGWHIEHTLLTIDRIMDRLAQTNPADYRKKFSFPKLIVFTLNKIPRGRAKAPKKVQPVGEISETGLLEHLALTRKRLTELTTLDPGQFFEHPYFGDLKLKEAIRFLEIHTRHHLKIIEQIGR